MFDGVHPATGRDRYRSYAGSDPRNAAEKLLAELVKRVHDLDYRAPDRITLGDYLVER